MRVYDTKRKVTWPWNFSTREYAEEAIRKGHSHDIRHLAVLDAGEEYENVYIDFGDICRNKVGITSQYGAYFIDGLANHSRLCDDLRVVNPNDWSYHTWKIHKDDAPIFVDRVKKWRGFSNVRKMDNMARKI